MLTPPDADLCRRDTSLPGLPILLDPEAVLDLLRDRADTGETARAIRPTYLRYKPGLSCLGAFAVDVGGRELLVYAQAYAPDAREKYSKLTGPDEVRGPLGPAHFPMPEHGIVVSAFPNDRKLKAIRRLLGPEAFGSFLAKLNPEVDAGGSAFEVLSYKPERRLVGRVSTGGRPWAVVRVYAEEAYERARANAAAFQTTPRVRVARVLGKSLWQQVLAVEYLEGHSLDALIRDGQREDVERIATAVARALADLHAQPAQRLRATDAAAAGERLFELAQWIGFVCPDLEDGARRLARRLRVALDSTRSEIEATHGDFYASQVLLDPADPAGPAAVLDFDEAVRGEVVADVANFVAHLESDAIRGHVSPEWASAWGRALVDAYHERSRFERSSRYAVHLALGLFRLLPHPFRRREPKWVEHTARMFRRAEEVAAEL
jgi:hypothetical protein